VRNVLKKAMSSDAVPLRSRSKRRRQAYEYLISMRGANVLIQMIDSGKAPVIRLGNWASIVSKPKALHASKDEFLSATSIQSWRRSPGDTRTKINEA
jgi:hypothetical protein